MVTARCGVWLQWVKGGGGTRGRRPGRGELTRLRRSGADPTCSGHVGAGEDRPFGPATRRAGGAGRAAAGGERRPAAGGRRAAGLPSRVSPLYHPVKVAPVYIFSKVCV